MATTIQFKRGSTANLQNITPAAGEPVWDKQLQKLKVGDGENLYRDLPYVGDVNFDQRVMEINGSGELSLFNYEYAEPGMAPVVNDLRLLNWKKVVTEDDIETIVAEVKDELAEELAELTGKVDSLDVRVDNIVDNIIPPINEELIDLQNQVTQNHADIDEIKAELEDIHPEDIQAAIDKVETFDGQLDLIEDSLTDIQEKDNQQDERLDALEAKNEEQDATLEDHEERLEALENGGIDTSKIYTTDDIMVIDGGTAYTVLIDAHAPLTTEPEEEP